MIRALVLALLLAAPAVAQGTGGFSPMAPAFWPLGPAPDPVTLLEPLYRNFPERIEGRPTLKISMRREGAQRLVVDVELAGLLDDSIEARAFRAVVEREERGWMVVALGTRARCARDARRAWTTRPCS
ncbi:hypothetical protein ACE7GA_22080 [Roseomonas sp. CCTCC AB2023176]|uniref:hypothetical protein n=1 Tax=Roseomonas sp. CCTCC AB2023176 TaxID=3342640 RepID=UPI0035D6B6C8